MHITNYPKLTQIAYYPTFIVPVTYDYNNDFNPWLDGSICSKEASQRVHLNGELRSTK